MYAKQAFLHTSPTKTGGMYAKLPFLHTHSPNTQCAVNTLSSNWTVSHTLHRRSLFFSIFSALFSFELCIHLQSHWF